MTGDTALTHALQVWHLRLTLHFLSDAGNLLDCASLAAMAALRHFRKPELEVLGDETIVVSCSCFRGLSAGAFPEAQPLRRPRKGFAHLQSLEPSCPSW